MLLVPPRGPSLSLARANDWLVPFAWADADENLTVSGAPFDFDGGDFLISDDCVVATAAWAAKKRARLA
mgnify:CR=1 FL=1